MTPVEITAGRMMLRPWSGWDADAVYQACQDSEIQRWTTVPSPYTQQDARAFVTELAPAGWEAGTMATWGVFDATTAELLASVGLHRISDGGGEIGYWCAPGARNQGVLTEAVAAVCRWGFGALGLEIIEWIAGVGNWPSRAVAEKCGFLVEGTHRLAITQRGIRMDAWRGSLLAGDTLIDRRQLPAPPVLTDGVVTLRGWRPDDGSEEVRAFDDPLIAQWLPVPTPYTEEHSQSYLTQTVPTLWAEGRAAHLAVTDAGSGQLLGGLSLLLQNRRHGYGEVGYWTAASARGRGVAGRAARLGADWGLHTLELSRVELLAHVDNRASHRVAEQAGFTLEGISRQVRRDRNGVPYDAQLFSLTRDP